MNFKRKLITGLLGLATLCGCLGACIFSNSNIYATEVNAVSEEHDHSGWTPISSLPTTSGNYYLTADITVDIAWMAPNGTTNLCLNGHVIKSSSTNTTTSVIGVGKGESVDVVLNIYDCGTNEHYFEYDNHLGKYIDNPTEAQKASAIKVCGGCITGGYKSKENAFGAGIAVYGEKAKLTLYGGNIIGNYCTGKGSAGGGVSVAAGASFVMKGGLISLNKAEHTSSLINGGGAFVDNGTFTLDGGVISNNYCDKYGGGVCINANGNMEMKNGSIINNTALYWGGGVHNNGQFTMNSGTIVNNTAVTNGGGGINSDGTTNINGDTSGVAIQDNQCGGTNSNGGHQIRKGYGTCTINGYCTIDNKNNDLVGVTNKTTKTKINFNKQGGTSGWAYNNPQLYNVDMNRPSNLSEFLPYRNGCTFQGYFDAPVGGTKYYNASGTSAKTWDKIVAETTLYAQWNPATYLVTFDKQGGTGGSDSSYISNFDSSSANNDKITIPQITGYTFLGYFDQPSGQGNQVYNASGEFIKRNKSTYVNKTLYANWTANSYTVSLDPQGGTGGTTSITPTFGVAMPEITLPTRDYYDFSGYFTGINGDGTKYYNADGTSARSWDIDSNITLYAYWIKTINNFASEFLMKTGNGVYCDGSLDNSIKEDLVKSFSMVDSFGKNAFKEAQWIRGQTEILDDIVNAKSRYCYMVVELGINDFLKLFSESELKALMHRGSIISIFNDGEDGSSIILVASLSILTITTITSYILFRKRKEE